MYEYKAKVRQSYPDGVFTADVELGFEIRALLKLRLNSIKVLPEALAYMATHLDGQWVTLKTSRSDVFTDWLAIVVMDDNTVFNHDLILKKLAVEVKLTPEV